MPKGAHQSTHDVYNSCQKAQRKGKRDKKKLLLPSMRTQPINEVNLGHWIYIYIQISP